MKFINDNFYERGSEFIFLQKSLIYVFFIFIYDLLYGLNSSTREELRPINITREIISKIKLKSDDINNKMVENKVFEATQRRTTNVKERNILFNYLKGSLKS